MKTAWGAEKIEEIAVRLASIRSELELRILVSLRATVDAQGIRNDARFDMLNGELQTIIGAILDGNKQNFGKLYEQTRAISRRQDQTDSFNRQYRDDILGAISTMVISHAPSLVRASAAPLNVPFEIATKAQHAVLDHLSFRGMDDREFDIALAHQSTFRWILSDSSAQDKPWTNFIGWLRHEGGCYWINGKAASGKSTLIKFIMKQRETLDALEYWAGANRLFVASFYFWRLGTTLQKSQTGLLRSLLYEILGEYRDLIARVLPGFYNELAERIQHPNNSREAPHPLTHTEVKFAFLKLIEQLPDSTRVCLFIDGVDEYDGDHAEISELFKQVASLKVKLVLTSRPVRACRDAFGSCPGLRLQDLTGDDITTYIDDRIGNNRQIQRLRQEDALGVEDLVTEISLRASGVFLWVYLVVKSLIQGLKNFDGIEDLHQRLNQFPTELEALYKHMMETMEPLYRKQASRYLQIVLKSTEVQIYKPLSLLQMSFADEKDTGIDFNMKVGLLSQSEVARRCEATDSRLISRCCGLVESQDRKPYATVSFLHKSVVDFLWQPDIWEYITDLTADIDFDVNLTLLRSCLLLLKASPVDTKPPEMKGWDGATKVEFKWSLLYNTTHSLLTYCRLAETSLGQAHALYLDEMNRVLTENINAVSCEFAKSPLTLPWTKFMPLLERGRYEGRNTPLSLPASFGLLLHVSEALAIIEPCYLTGKGRTILAEVVRTKNFVRACRNDFLSKLLQVIRCLLEHKADPNFHPNSRPLEMNGSSAWTTALCGLRDLWHPEDDSQFSSRESKQQRGGSISKTFAAAIIAYFDVFEMLLQYGASPNAVIVGDLYDGGLHLTSDSRSALAAVEDYTQHFASYSGIRLSDRKTVEDQGKRLSAALKEKGAKRRRWLNGNLIEGPAEEKTLKEKLGSLASFREWRKSSSPWYTPETSEFSRNGLKPLIL